MKSRTPSTLIKVYLDRFKEFNDRCGFLAGDDTIRLTALLLEKFREQISDKAHVGNVARGRPRDLLFAQFLLFEPRYHLIRV